MRKQTIKALPLIQEKYWPKGEDGEKDMDCVWVGPFLCGLTHLNIFPDIHKAKAFFFEVNDPGKQGFSLIYERRNGELSGDWPWADSSYNRPMDVRRISGKEGESVEPGEIMNSPTHVPVEQEDIWRQEPDIEEWDVEIREDMRFGLHQFFKGDKITKTWYYPLGKRVITERYVLRNPSEGSSLVPTMRQPLDREVL